MLTVEQADRDAAAMAFYCKPLANGAHDADRRVQAFAAHRIAGEQAGRIAALEEAAGVAETLAVGGGTLSSWINANESPMGATKRHIAAAIRALKGPQ